MKKSIVTVMLAFLLGGTVCLSGCGLGEHRTNYDPNKKQVIIGLMQGDLGRAWLDEIAANYIKDNPGTEVIIDVKSADYNNNNLQDSIAVSGKDLFLVNDIYLRDFVAQDLVANITDVVTEKDENGRSIASSINNDLLRDAFQINGKYYGLPYFTTSFGIVYDVDLFESKNLYYNEDATGFVTSPQQTRSPGPDGDPATVEDNGLPATYSQFSRLLVEMRRQNIIPFDWCGKSVYYQQRMLASWWADYEGAENFNLNMTFDGNYTFPVNTLTESEVSKWNAVVNQDGTQTVKITNENAFLLQRQPGKKYGIQLAYDIMSNTKNYASNAPSPSQTNIMAQDEYLNSIDTDNPIAFLPEGGWWENGARATFDKMAVDNEKYAYGVRRFATLPVPKADDGSSAEGRTLFVGGTRSSVIVNKKATHPELALDFLKYMHSEESMNIFLKHTGVARPYNYELDPKVYESLTYFQKEQYDLMNDGETEFAYFDLSTNPLRLGNIAYFNNWLWTSKLKQTWYDPISAFYNDQKITVDEYFKGMSDYYSGNWPSIK